MTHTQQYPLNRLSIAPMMDWTDRHQRYFMRLISKNALLYTEMVTTGAIIHGDQERHLGYSDAEHPIALQLGGSDPKDLAICAKLAQERNYDEINLNVGCPSDRVQNGMFGACLMAKPQLVADCIAAMRDVVDIPVTVKCRVGIDDLDSYEYFRDFVGTVANTGCDTFIVHARKAWLQGLSPKQNREIPELEYDKVIKLKQDFNALCIALNGGLADVSADRQYLDRLDGLMYGRVAYHNPYAFAQADQLLFDPNAPMMKRSDIIEQLLPYIDTQLSKGTYLSHISRHILGLCQGLPGARMYRRHISENAHKRGADCQVIVDAFEFVKQHNTNV